MEVKKVDCDNQMAMLRKIQEMEFVAIELNLYLDTHPEDVDALNDFNCAVEVLRKHKKKYEEEFGPFSNFGSGGYSDAPWQWIRGPWPWEM
jgi:spore coat protein JB